MKLLNLTYYTIFTESAKQQYSNLTISFKHWFIIRLLHEGKAFYRLPHRKDKRKNNNACPTLSLATTCHYIYIYTLAKTAPRCHILPHAAKCCPILLHAATSVCIPPYCGLSFYAIINAKILNLYHAGILRQRLGNYVATSSNVINCWSADPLDHFLIPFTIFFCSFSCHSCLPMKPKRSKLTISILCTPRCFSAWKEMLSYFELYVRFKEKNPVLRETR